MSLKLEEVRIKGNEIDLILVNISLANKFLSRTKTYFYDIVLHGTNEVVGHIDLRLGMNKSLYYYGNIGYTVYQKYRGNNYAYQACKLLKTVAKAEKMKQLIITCNPDNFASLRTCELLGAKSIGAVKVPMIHPLYLNGEKIKCVFILEIEERL